MLQNHVPGLFFPEKAHKTLNVPGRVTFQNLLGSIVKSKRKIDGRRTATAPIGADQKAVLRLAFEVREEGENFTRTSEFILGENCDATAGDDKEEKSKGSLQQTGLGTARKNFRSS